MAYVTEELNDGSLKCLGQSIVLHHLSLLLVFLLLFFYFLVTIIVSRIYLYAFWTPESMLVRSAVPKLNLPAKPF
jgi:hypothetical protein